MLAAVEPIRMIEPPSLRSGRAFCTVNNVPFDVSIKRVGVLVFGHLRNGGEPATACICNEDVEGACLGAHDREQFVEVGHIRNVAGNASRSVSDIGDGIDKFLFTTACHEQPGAFIGKALCNRAPDAAVRTRYHRNLAVKSAHKFSFCGSRG